LASTSLCMPSRTSNTRRRALSPGLIPLAYVFGLLAVPPVSALQTASAQPTPAVSQSSLRIVGIAVQPTNPGPDTLCRLRIRLLNPRKGSVSDLHLRVTGNGQRLDNFMNDSWRSLLPPGKETDVQVFNFWSSEVGRPYASDGKLVIEGRLTGARSVVHGSSNAAALADAIKPLPGPFSVTLTRTDRR